MSNALFPTLPGLGWSVIRTPMWSTNIQHTTSGREIRTAFFSYPIYKYSLTYEVLRQGAAFLEWQALMGFFNARNGAFDSFLLDDPNDNTVAAMPFGTGDAVDTTFQLGRTLGGFFEPVFNTHATPQIFKNGVLQTVVTHYTISSSGLVTFVTAPAAAAVLTWTGTYYWRVRFNDDTVDFENFMSQFWAAKKVDLVTVKGPP
jgi:uncharacterized protein (TIGR02217 family)